MWRPLELTPHTLRSEVLGRLSLLVTEFETKEIKVPRRELIDKTISALGPAELVTTIFCGPLEGYLRRNSYPQAPIASEINKEEFSQIIASLQGNELGDGWENLSFHSHLFAYDDSMLKEMMLLVKNIEIPTDAIEKKQEFLHCLASIAFIAASQPAEALADELVTTLLRNVDKLKSEVDAAHGYQIILTASAAYCERSLWLDWLERRLADYAFFLPRGEASFALFQCLEVLKGLFPLKEWRFGRARKLAAAAIR
jgi:hypothetical protein